MRLSEIVNEMRGWYDIVNSIPGSDVCEVSDIASDLAFDIDRTANTLDEYLDDGGTDFEIEL